MSSRISMWVGLIGAAATIPLVQTIAVATSQVEVAETARTITVLITYPNGQGSGVILKHEGDVYTVLTAAHVVRKKVSYKIVTPDEKEYEVISSSIVSAPGDIDLAVVRFKATTKYPIAKLGNCNILKRGMDLYVSGFPGKDRAITSPVLVVREGKISANSNKVQVSGYSLIYSNDTVNGMSGGAVLNSNGELVAIHGIGDKDEDGRKNGFNLGIPIERFGTVASRMGVELNGQVAAIPKNTVVTADDYIASGTQKWEKGDDEGAIADLNRAIQIDPNSAEAYYTRGKVKYLKNWRGGDVVTVMANGEVIGAFFDEALADYNRAIQINPNYADAYRSRGSLKRYRVESVKVDIRGAFADYSRAIELNPNDAIAYRFRGEVKERDFKDLRGALIDYNRAIQIDPVNRKSREKRIGLQIKAKNYKEVLQDYDYLIKLNVNNDYLHHKRGEIKETTQDYQGALADYNQAIKINDRFIAAYFSRAKLKDRIRNYQGALSDYNQYIKLEYSSSLAYYNRAVLRHDRLKDRKGGIADLGQAIRLIQTNNSAVSNFSDLTEYREAIALMARWEPNSIDFYTKVNPAVYMILGIDKGDKDDYKGSIAEYNRAIQIYPNYVKAYIYRANMKKEINDYRGALADYNRAIQIQSNESSTYTKRADIKEKMNDYQGSLADYNRAIQIKPDNSDAYNGRGLLKNNRLNDLQGALIDYNQAIIISPRNADAYYNRSLLKFNSLKEQAGAINDMKQAVKIYKQWANNEDNQDAEYNKKYKDALDLLKKWQQSSGN